MTVISRGKTRDFKITGVLADLPKNSHIEATDDRAHRLCRVGFRHSRPAHLLGLPGRLGLFEVAPGQRPEDDRSGSPGLGKAQHPRRECRRMRASMPATSRIGTSSTSRTSTSGAAQSGAMRPGNDRRTIITFAVIAVLILGMAVVNFINLATARASQRAREVALRKVLGATRNSLSSSSSANR